MYYRNRFILRLFAAVVIGVVCFSTTETLAAPPPTGDVMSIEQDWIIILDTANSTDSSPQIISGFPAPGSTRVLQFAWNHLDIQGLPGGFELQLWDDNLFMGGCYYVAPPFAAPNERIVWTQRYTIINSNPAALIHEAGLVLLEGTSWGQLITPTDAPLVYQMPGDTTNLNGYIPEMSIAESAIVSGAHHVQWFGILWTRYYNAAGQLLSEDPTAHAVYANYASQPVGP